MIIYLSIFLSATEIPYVIYSAQTQQSMMATPSNISSPGVYPMSSCMCTTAKWFISTDNWHKCVRRTSKLWRVYGLTRNWNNLRNAEIANKWWHWPQTMFQYIYRILLFEILDVSVKGKAINMYIAAFIICKCSCNNFLRYYL